MASLRHELVSWILAVLTRWLFENIRWQVHFKKQAFIRKKCCCIASGYNSCWWIMAQVCFNLSPGYFCCWVGVWPGWLILEPLLSGSLVLQPRELVALQSLQCQLVPQLSGYSPVPREICGLRDAADLLGGSDVNIIWYIFSGQNFVLVGTQGVVQQEEKSHLILDLPASWLVTEAADSHLPFRHWCQFKKGICGPPLPIGSFKNASLPGCHDDLMALQSTCLICICFPSSILARDHR